MTYPYRLVASDGEVLASGKSIEDVEKIRQDKIKNFKSQIKLNAKEIEAQLKEVGKQYKEASKNYNRCVEEGNGEEIIRYASECDKLVELRTKLRRKMCKLKRASK